MEHDKVALLNITRFAKLLSKRLATGRAAGGKKKLFSHNLGKIYERR
jgi:hypothetical protein